MSMVRMMLLNLSKMLTMRRRMMLMLRKAELMMVLAAGSNVRIRTEDGGRFTSTRALPYIALTYMYQLHCNAHTYIYTRMQCRTIHTQIHTTTSTRADCCAMHIRLYTYAVPYQTYIHIYIQIQAHVLCYMYKHIQSYM